MGHKKTGVLRPVLCFLIIKTFEQVKSRTFFEFFLKLRESAHLLVYPCPAATIASSNCKFAPGDPEIRHGSGIKAESISCQNINTEPVIPISGSILLLV
jgi:hypothetical protein